LIFPEEWLKDEYGEIFKKVIISEPVMQKGKLGGLSAKLPQGRLRSMSNTRRTRKDLKPEKMDYEKLYGKLYQSLIW